MDLSRLARGGTPITLDRPRLLLFDMAALWLLIRKYGNGYLQALYGVPATVPGQAPNQTLVLNSMEALQFYLWVGLQADCKLRDEELTLEQVGEFINPLTFPRIFESIITALMRDTFNPSNKGEDVAGKADAAAAGPAVVAAPGPGQTRQTGQRKRSISTKKSASHSARSAGQRKGSGQER